MPLEEDIANNIANNIENVGAGVGGFAALGLFIKAALFKAKKIDTDTAALESYGVIIKQLRDELEETTRQLREVIDQNNETLKKLDEVIRENTAFRAKIDTLEAERYSLFTKNHSLKKFINEHRKPHPDSQA